MANRETFLNMLSDIRKHKRNKSDLLAYYIQKRLNLSLNNYYSDLNSNYNMLTRKDSLKVLKEINKGDN